MRPDSGGRTGRWPATALVLIALLLSACSGAAVSASPSPSQAADPVTSVTIGTPYSLAAPDPVLAESFRKTLSGSLDASAAPTSFGGREVDDNGTLAGHVFVMGFTTGALSDATYRSTITATATGSNTVLTPTSISGVQVSLGCYSMGCLSMFRAGDRVIILTTPTVEAMAAITRALVDANK